VKRLGRTVTVSSAILGLVGWLAWQLAPAKPIIAIANLSDPARLATLGERGANARLNKIVYWLHESQNRGLALPTIIGFPRLSIGQRNRAPRWSRNR
jgi:hypothetical protein